MKKRNQIYLTKSGGSVELKGVILGVNLPHMTFYSKTKVNTRELNKKALDGKIYGILSIYEKDMITDLQRKHFYALCKDYEIYTGVPLEAAESWFKYRFMLKADLDDFPSLARNGMKKSVASELLEFVITYMIQNDIPFRKQQFYLTMDQNRMLYGLTMKRLCWVCGKPSSDIHHATNLVGMGRNRHTHDHAKSGFMCLCRNHHQEVHQIGLTAFREKHHVAEIKLSEEDIKELKL